MDPATVLPVELTRYIVGFAGREMDRYWAIGWPEYSPKSRLSSLSHSWEAIARPFLYSLFDVNRQEESLLFERTLIQRPELATLVKFLEIHGPRDNTEEWEDWRSRVGARLLVDCSGLLELVLNGERGGSISKWPRALDPSIAGASLTSLTILRCKLPQFAHPLPHLRTLCLRRVDPPTNIPAFARVLPSLTLLCLDHHRRSLTSKTSKPLRRLLLALAPQLDTLRLRNRGTGVALQLVQEICSLGTSLRVLDVSSIISDESTPPFLPPSRPSNPDMPALELHLHASSYISVLDLGYVEREEDLWEDLADCREAALSLSGLRRIKAVVVPLTYKNDYRKGFEYAKAQAEVMEWELRYEESFDFEIYR